MLKKIITICSLFVSCLSAKEIIYIEQGQICKSPYINNAILRKDQPFVDDFLTLHALLSIERPKSVFEIGTCTGEGTLIIKNAVGENAVVHSLELPLGESCYDIQVIGGVCHLGYNQIIGNSMHVDYSEYYPIEAWFIDGAHDYDHVFYETQQAMLSNPKVLVWHDADIDEVFEGIKDGLENHEKYLLFRVKNTRIAFSVPENSKIVEVVND